MLQSLARLPKLNKLYRPHLNTPLNCSFKTFLSILPVPVSGGCYTMIAMYCNHHFGILPATTSRGVL